MGEFLWCNGSRAELLLQSKQFRTPVLRLLLDNTLGKGMNSFIPPDMGQIVPLLFFYMDGFDIR